MLRSPVFVVAVSVLCFAFGFLFALVLSIEKPHVAFLSHSSASPFALKWFAYAFYATDEEYACAVEVLVHSIKLTNPDPAISFVCLVPSYLGQAAQTRLVAIGVQVRIVDRIPINRDSFNSYYNDVLIKLRVFQLTDFDRVVFLDSDSLVFQNLDHLFLLPECVIAAPRAYWLKHEPCFFTSWLMVVTPSEAAFQRLLKRRDANEGLPYDMDLLNAEFAREFMMLPNWYGMITNEFKEGVNSIFGSDHDWIYANIKVIHFTAGGKPWNWEHKKTEHERKQLTSVFEKWVTLRESYQLCRD